MTKKRTLKDLSGTERQKLVTAILDYFTYDPDGTNHADKQWSIADMLRDNKFDTIAEPSLRRLVRSLRDLGLLYQPPGMTARASRYVTTRAGRTFAEEHRGEPDSDE